MRRGGPLSRFQHEAYLYRGQDEFVTSATAFVREGLAGGEAVMVAVNKPKIDLLRAQLDGEAARVRFVDLVALGRNPARILPLWREFADENLADSRPVRGIGEPIWDGRGAAEIAESQLQEAMLNLAFEGGSGFLLRCPYDADALDRSVVEAAQRSHPVVVDAGGHRESVRYAGTEYAAAAFADPLPEPSVRPHRLTFGPDDLPRVRDIVVHHAVARNLDDERAGELVLAVHEVATNSLKYGGDWGTLRIWQESCVLVCEIRDRGRISEPLVGHSLPADSDEGGRGLWLAHRLCDLVQIRSSSGGTVVRLHTWL